jgi:hypothetical protein
MLASISTRKTTHSGPLSHSPISKHSLGGQYIKVGTVPKSIAQTKFGELNKIIGLYMFVPNEGMFFYRMTKEF